MSDSEFVTASIYLGPIVIILVFALIFHKKIMRPSAVIDYDELSLKGGRLCRCPKCDKEMKRGFIVAARGIVWRDESDRPISILSQRYKFLENTMNITISRKENRAWRCEDCQYVLIDYSTFVGKIKQ